MADDTKTKGAAAAAPKFEDETIYCVQFNKTVNLGGFDIPRVDQPHLPGKVLKTFDPADIAWAKADDTLHPGAKMPDKLDPPTHDFQDARPDDKSDDGQSVPPPEYVSPK